MPVPRAATCAAKASRSLACASVKACAAVPVGRDAVPPAGLQVGRRGEARDVGRAGGGDRRLLVGAPGTHLEHRPVTRRAHHPGRRGRDRAVVVEHRQHEGFQQHALGEAAGHGEDRGAGEVDLALGVAVDVAAEAVAGEPVEGRLVDHAAAPQRLELRVAEAEALQRVQQPPGAADDAVPPAGGQDASEDLEDAAAAGRSRRERRLQHGQLVVVGEQRRRSGLGYPRERGVRCGRGEGDSRGEDRRWGNAPSPAGPDGRMASWQAAP